MGNSVTALICDCGPFFLFLSELAILFLAECDEDFAFLFTPFRGAFVNYRCSARDFLPALCFLLVFILFDEGADFLIHKIEGFLSNPL